MKSLQNKKFTVLGIDASLTGTGLCLINSDFLKGEKPKTLTLTNNLKGIPRILFIENQIRDWAKDADLIVIENYAYEKKYNREALAELQGVIKRRLYIMDKDLLIVNTQKAKKILTGNGIKPKKFKELNTKEWTILGAKDNYGIDFANKDNECDAFGLALIGLFYLIYQDEPSLIEEYKLPKKVIREIVNPKEKKKKKTIHYYYNLPYKIEVSKNEEGNYLAYCPALDYAWEGNTPQQAFANAINGKKTRIKELKKNKVRFKTAQKYLGGISYITERNKTKKSCL
ncbi:type II toxin-antitoxin system HicB family antitoxin [Alkaliphilus sp. B6464]|uniref:type II toxin-antitoxin system HicB family antitoxin n=1 Tax=Alkaliphilus sp. B6464 TaxID=2731219 RepID=UPI001BAE38FC|nr:hypothetical protein [Alkaliphilus sp. B6464]QUH22146.1 hypothetical protein HYG84_19760 [Alkaliphilus sp. B6464]